MKVIIAGSRHIQENYAIHLVAKSIEISGWKDEITEVIHGDARGVDRAAGRFAKGRWPVMAVPADWRKHGLAAGPIRNRQMAEMADALIAIWDGHSRGTKNMIDTARKIGLRVYVHPNGTDHEGDIYGSD